MLLRLLVVASETPDQQETRRRYSGAASHETYERTLRRIAADVAIDHVSCVDRIDPLTTRAISRFDGAFFAGSPIRMHEDSFESRAAAGFMQSVFASGTPSFGSCAGLQIAAVAAGGTTGERNVGIEAAFARRITPTATGKAHPLLAGRPVVFDAPAMHAHIVRTAPEGTTILAANPHTPIEAAEIRHGAGTFWGVQYHPEISIAEIADSLRRQSDDLIDEGLFADEDDLERYAALLETLDRDHDRLDIAWQLGLDPETTDFDRRTRELGNFIAHLRERGAAAGRA